MWAHSLQMASLFIALMPRGRTQALGKFYNSANKDLEHDFPSPRDVLVVPGQHPAYEIAGDRHYRRVATCSAVEVTI